jgi:hypothetical protein
LVSDVIGGTVRTRGDTVEPLAVMSREWAKAGIPHPEGVKPRYVNVTVTPRLGSAQLDLSVPSGHG